MFGVCASADPCPQDLRNFWEPEKHTRWFREHPVLSDFWNYFPITDVQPRDSIVSNEETMQSFPGYSCLSVAMSHRTKDPAMDLSKVIPVRIYGDGAEAQRYLEKIILDRFGWQSLEWLCFLPTAQESKSSRWSPFSFLAVQVQKGQMRYHWRPKCHMLGHLTFHFLPRNPRYYMCYADEDFIARSKRVAEKSHPLHMSRLALLRYTIHACMLWHGETVWGKIGSMTVNRPCCLFFKRLRLFFFLYRRPLAQAKRSGHPMLLCAPGRFGYIIAKPMFIPSSTLAFWLWARIFQVTCKMS